MRISIYLAAFVLLFYGCGDFLEEKSQSEIRPSTVTDMERILEGEAYPEKGHGYLLNIATDIFTDDWESNWIPLASAYLNRKEYEKQRFFWAANMFDESSGNEDLSFWVVPYDRIKGCNIVLEYLDRMYGDDNKREYVRGEARVLRGYYYMMLINFFSMPYTYGDPETQAGLPLKLTADVTLDQLTKVSVAAIYRQIEEDLLTGSTLMEEHPMTVAQSRVNYLAGYGLLSRMYMYKADWDNALKYADKVLKEYPLLADLKSIPKSWGGVVRSVYSTQYSSEMLWSRMGTRNSMFNGNNVPPFTPGTQLLALYTQDRDNSVSDLRGDISSVRGYMTQTYVYERNESGSNVAYYFNLLMKDNDTDCNSGGIRVAEMYLNRAEAYCRKYLESGNTEYAQSALKDLNYLRLHRFASGYVDKTLSDFADAGELLDFCLRERRRELCGEANHRWFDLRRLGMPEITHVFVDQGRSETTETLRQEDPRYALPIPAKVRERNTNL